MPRQETAAIQSSSAAWPGRAAGSMRLIFRNRRCAAPQNGWNERGLHGRAELICAGHEQMREYVKEPAAAAVFNLGYLPGGDHTLATRAETTLEAAGQALELLRPGGILSLCIYSGGDTGYEERDALLSWLKELDTRRWLVIVNSFYNRKNDPPLPVFVIRLE